MTAQSIRDAALFHFARDGYEGASLRAIADEVGIKNRPYMRISAARMTCFYTHWPLLFTR